MALVPTAYHVLDSWKHKLAIACQLALLFVVSFKAVKHSTQPCRGTLHPRLVYIHQGT